MGSYATWKATKPRDQHDLRTFEVTAQPTQPVEGLLAGMTIVLDKGQLKMSTPKTGLGAVLRRELRYLTTRPIYLFAIFGAPLLVTLMLLYMMGGGLPTNMPVAVVDEDHTPTSACPHT